MINGNNIIIIIIINNNNKEHLREAEFLRNKDEQHRIYKRRINN